MRDTSIRQELQIALAALAVALVCLLPRVGFAASGKCHRTVRKGDTVSGIAHRAGVTEANLIRANPELKKNPNRLRVGQKLDICRAKRMQAHRPQKCGKNGRIIIHEVGQGETLGGIAAHYSVSRDTLRRYNSRLKGRANSMIRAGERLRVCTRLRRYTHRKWFRDGVQLPEGDGYNVRRPHNAWGTPPTVEAIQTAIATYRELEPEAPLVQVGDISRKNGGPLREHVSHQEGRDVDIGYVYDEPDDEESGRRTMNLDRSWKLLRSFAEHDAVAVIFIDYALQKRLYEYAQSIGVDQSTLDAIFEYPRGSDEEAVFYHWPGHDRHFHVRFKDGSEEEEEEEEDESKADSASDPSDLEEVRS